LVADKFDNFPQKFLFPSPIASGSALPILISRPIPTPSAVAEVNHDCVAEHSYQAKTDSQSDPKSDPSLGEIRGVSTSDRSASVEDEINIGEVTSETSSTIPLTPKQSQKYKWTTGGRLQTSLSQNVILRQNPSQKPNQRTTAASRRLATMRVLVSPHRLVGTDVRKAPLSDVRGHCERLLVY
jgi:hypothetical protein